MMDRPGSKPSTPSGISSAQATELNRKIHEAHAKALDNEKRIAELEKVVNDKSQWNNTVRGWIGKTVFLRLLLPDNDLVGVLRGLDRYTLQIETEGSEDVIIHKGAIATIELYK